MTLLQLTEIVYASHLAARRMATQRYGVPWRSLPPALRDRWNMATALAVHQPWTSAELVCAAWHIGEPPTPWSQLTTAERCHWQMIADVARAWRTEVTI